MVLFGGMTVDGPGASSGVSRHANFDTVAMSFQTLTLALTLTLTLTLTRSPCPS